jgi:ABC-type transport system substrate-binding protein
MWLGEFYPAVLMTDDASHAHAEAEQYYLRAIGILQEQGRDELAARTLLKLGLVYTASFDADKAQKTYDEAFALWEPLREAAAPPDLRLPPAVLRLGMEQPRTLDPGQVDDDVSTFMAAQLFEGLVRIGPGHNVLPAVAARWEVADGGTRYLFHLRDGVRWNDGNSVTAGDFEYAWKRNLDRLGKISKKYGVTLVHRYDVVQHNPSDGSGNDYPPDPDAKVAASRDERPLNGWG